MAEIKDTGTREKIAEGPITFTSRHPTGRPQESEIALMIRKEDAALAPWDRRYVGMTLLPAEARRVATYIARRLTRNEGPTGSNDDRSPAVVLRSLAAMIEAEARAAALSLPERSAMVLRWLAREDRSSLGECEGPDLDDLVARGLARIDGPEDRGGHRIVTLTPEGIEAARVLAEHSASVGEELIVDLVTAPQPWPAAVAALGIIIGGSEGQPIADQVRLRNCLGVPNDLPAWLRRGGGA